MTDYRLYFTDDAGHIKRAMVLECLSDKEAVETAEKLCDGLDLELWHHARVVKKIPKAR